MPFASFKAAPTANPSRYETLSLSRIAFGSILRPSKALPSLTSIPNPSDRNPVRPLRDAPPPNKRSESIFPPPDSSL